MRATWYHATRRDRPIEKHGERGAAHINHDVAQRCGPRWDERLVKLIAGSVGPARQEDDSSRQGAARLKHGMDKGAIKQNREHRVLRNMGRFAEEKFHPNQGDGRYGRKEPAEQGNNNARSIFGGHQISGAGKDDCHPQKNREPVSKKCFQARKAGLISTNPDMISSI